MTNGINFTARAKRGLAKGPLLRPLERSLQELKPPLPPTDVKAPLRPNLPRSNASLSPLLQGNPSAFSKISVLFILGQHVDRDVCVQYMYVCACSCVKLCVMTSLGMQRGRKLEGENGARQTQDKTMSYYPAKHCCLGEMLNAGLAHF